MKGDDRKEMILEAAIKVFSEYGYEKASIAKICDLAGIARGTLYQYFDNKQQLFHELVATYTKRMAEHMKPPKTDDPAGAGRRQRAHRLLKALEEVYKHREVYGIIIKDGVTKNPETYDLVHNLHNKFIDWIVCEFMDGADQGFSPPDPEFAAVFLYGSLLMVVHRYVIDADEPIAPMELAKKVAELRGLFSMRLTKDKKKKVG